MLSLDKTHLFILRRNGSGVNRTHEYLDAIHGVRTLKTELDRQFVVSIPSDEPCIVVDDLPNIEQKRFVEYLAGAVLFDPEKVYTYAGTRFEDVKDGRLSKVQKFTKYNRMPFTPRYRKNDVGPVVVDAIDENVFSCSAGTLVDIIDVLSGSKLDKNTVSIAISRLGLSLKCIDPAIDWSGLPRQNASNAGTMKMDSNNTMPLFTYQGWHEEHDKSEALKRHSDKVAVVVTTHNRTDTAKLALESLVSKLKYPNLEWIIADDRSEPGHLQALLDLMRSLGVNNVKHTTTTDDHWGLGASLNNALQVAFKTCDVVLTTEDDWFLQRDLDLSKHVTDIVENKTIGTIRLGGMYKSEDHLLEYALPGYKKVTNGPAASRDKSRMLLNLQVALRHKRLYDALGFYVENRKPEDVEKDMNERFCTLTLDGFENDLVVLWPSAFERKTLDSRTNPFVHFGESTCGHDYEVASWVSENSDEPLPILSVVFQTHSRTATACFCLESLCKNLKYRGKTHYCICDDGSDRGHVGALVKVLKDGGVNSYSVHTTSKDRWGLGASINNGLSWSFKFTDTVLTVEDDFLLRKPFDMTKYVKELLKPDVAGIKLAANSERFNPVVECNHRGFKKVTADKSVSMSQRYTFNNLVMLRHKRVFDVIGMYAENVFPDVMEVDALMRFNNAFDNGNSDELKVLWPTKLKLNTYDTEWFLHIGKSTLGHTSGMDTAKPYRYLADEALNKKRIEEADKYFESSIHVIIPCYDNPDLLDRCLKSIKNQKDAPKTMVTVVDDCSNENAIEIADVVCKYDFTVFMPLHEKRMAGGARNAALRHSPVTAPYTMFLDSDDEFFTEYSLKHVAEALEENGNPDMLCLSYMFKNELRTAVATSPTKMCTVAPWSRCVKTELVREFVENRRVCNDTIQYLRTLDSVNSVASTKDPIVKYNTDNKYSGWHSDSFKTSRARLEGMCLTMLDILFENMEKRTTKEAALNKLLYIEKEFNKSLETMKEKMLG